ncbi:MAG: hypothetical protein EOM67_03945 [Spirochaetia bacterium]|nr:hypothetical protein [Spirochaetia bacterium]
MKKMTRITLTLLVVFSLMGCATMNETHQTGMYGEEKDSTYLLEYFSIPVMEGTIETSRFDSAMMAVIQRDVVDETNLNIFKSLIEATNLSELAATYSEEKAITRLTKAGLFSVDSEIAPFVACAIDANLVTPMVAKELLASSSLNGEVATYLLMQVAKTNGLARNSIGNISDKDILEKISLAFNGYSLFTDNNLDKIGALAVQQKASTGYNLKKDSDRANFLSSYTLKYGHADETHLKQLVVLLNSEDIDAKMQIEPKVSVYEYLLDWGPVPEPDQFYSVLQFSDDLYLAYAVEYDVRFEFKDVSDLNKFDGIINTYSKKNDTNQAEGSEVRLIKGAWWQPLYSASFNPDEESFKEIVDCVLEENGYSIHPFSLKETSQELVSALEDLSGLEVSVEPFYVNNAFYRYLTGEDYQ